VAIHSLIPEDGIKEDGPHVAACARRKASSQTTHMCATFRQRLIKRDWRSDRLAVRTFGFPDLAHDRVHVEEIPDFGEFAVF
jgi:hypothetical protein